LWDAEKKRPVLYVEKFYTRNPHEELPKLIKALAIERAKTMRLTLLCDDESLPKYEGAPESLGGAADEYVDALSGIQNKTFKIGKSYVLYQA
jgi:hypothetical protein